MKLILKALLIIIPMSIVGLVVHKTFSYHDRSQNQQERGGSLVPSLLPVFKFKTVSGYLFTNADLPNKPLLLINFNSECEFCKSKIRQITKNISKFDPCEILLISSEEPDTLKKFYCDYGLDQHPNIKLLRSGGGEFHKLFGISSLPGYVVVNNQGEVVAAVNDNVSVKILLQQIKRIQYGETEKTIFKAN